MITQIYTNGDGYKPISLADVEKEKKSCSLIGSLCGFAEAALCLPANLVRKGVEGLLRCLERFSSVDHGLVVVSAGSSAAIAFSAAVPGIAGLPGQIISAGCSLFVNATQLRLFKFSKNLKLSLSARNRINQLSRPLRVGLEFFWYWMIANFIAGAIAQGMLTAENYKDIPFLFVTFFITGTTGYLLTRSAAIARIFFLYFPEDDSQSPAESFPKWVFNNVIKMVVGNRNLTGLAWFVDWVDNLVGAGLLYLDFFVIRDMYRLKLLTGLQHLGLPRLGLDLCSDDPTCHIVSDPVYYASASLTELNFLFFYITFKNLMNNTVRFGISSINYLIHRYKSRTCAAIGLLAVPTVSLIAYGSIGGLVKSRGMCDEDYVRIFMMAVNTSPLLMEISSQLEYAVNEMTIRAPLRMGTVGVETKVSELDSDSEPVDSLAGQIQNFSALWKSIGSIQQGPDATYSMIV